MNRNTEVYVEDLLSAMGCMQGGGARGQAPRSLKTYEVQNERKGQSAQCWSLEDRIPIKTSNDFSFSFKHLFTGPFAFAL